MTSFDGTHASLAAEFAAEIAAEFANYAKAIVGAGQAIEVTGQIPGKLDFSDWGALQPGSSWQPELILWASIK
jgi:hypothetical protein